MLHAKNVPERFWAECMRTVTYIINRLPQPKLGFMSPHELLWKVKPVVSHLKVFGCVCYVFVSATCLCLITKGASLRRRQFGVFLSDMMMHEKVGDAAIQPQESATP